MDASPSNNSTKKQKKRRLMVTHLLFSIHYFVFSESEKKLWRSSFTLILSWTLAWTPYALVFLASVTGHEYLITQHTDMLPGRTWVFRKADCTQIIRFDPWKYFFTLITEKYIGGKKTNSLNSIDYIPAIMPLLWHFSIAAVFCKLSVAANPFIYGLL